MKINPYIIGIDEVGRGPLAGPVTVSAVAIPVNFKFSFHLKPKLKDSKQLTENQREAWFGRIKKYPEIYRAVASVYPKVIDRINISRAANLAATRAFKKLVGNYLKTTVGSRVFLDGGLFLNAKVLSAIGCKIIPKTVVRADEKYNCVKLASIVAKVTRDKAMKRNHKKFPAYGFDEHKGYGTKSHIKAIKKYGPSLIHRQSFIKNFI